MAYDQLCNACIGFLFTLIPNDFEAKIYIFCQKAMILMTCILITIVSEHISKIIL
jgi:hypothetical protein